MSRMTRYGLEIKEYDTSNKLGYFWNYIINGMYNYFMLVNVIYRLMIVPNS